MIQTDNRDISNTSYIIDGTMWTKNSDGPWLAIPFPSQKSIANFADKYQSNKTKITVIGNEKINLCNTKIYEITQKSFGIKSTNTIYICQKNDLPYKTILTYRGAKTVTTMDYSSYVAEVKLPASINKENTIDMRSELEDFNLEKGAKVLEAIFK